MDHRDLAFDPFSKPHGFFNNRTMTGYLIDDDSEAAIEYYPDEDDKVIMVVPIHCHMEVCPDCDGRGTYVNPNIDRHGLTHDDFAEDPDFAESYFSGVYDIRCENCHGQNVVPVPDENDPNIHYYYELIQGHHEYAAERDAEMRYMYGSNY